tara:strand:+ start:2952 stop:3314 length:363 start_codon:yes stop_codon:yes gene_type:complete
MAYKDAKDQAAAAKRHYEANKQKIKDRSKKRNREQRKKNKEYIAFVKSMLSCVDCGEDNPVLLDFDHVRGEKKSNISDMANQSYSIETIQKEIDKCEPRCANCHRAITHKRRNIRNLQKE